MSFHDGDFEMALKLSMEDIQPSNKIMTQPIEQKRMEKTILLSERSASDPKLMQFRHGDIKQDQYQGIVQWLTDDTMYLEKSSLISLDIGDIHTFRDESTDTMIYSIMLPKWNQGNSFELMTIATGLEKVMNDAEIMQLAIPMIPIEFGYPVDKSCRMISSIVQLYYDASPYTKRISHLVLSSLFASELELVMGYLKGPDVIIVESESETVLSLDGIIHSVPQLIEAETPIEDPNDALNDDFGLF